ncbi:tryptophan 2,3-dioxygenase family protein [Streptomyces sp. DSM 118878]
METPYECYLRLPDLLALQRPRTAEDKPAQWADEHFFIAVHQSAEVLAGQALVDLERVQEPLERVQDPAPGPPAAPEGCRLAYVRRVTAVVELLEQHLAVLEHLSPASFAAFRPLLENASGAQSSQFATLFARIDALASRSTPTTPTPKPPGAAATARPPGGPGGDGAARAWWELRAAVVRWRTRHLLLVERMIGDQPGTGGTSGLAYLRERIGLPPRDTDAVHPGPDPT